MTVLTGGYGNFDQQIKVSLVDALSGKAERRKERGFTVTTLREMILMGTNQWTLYKPEAEPPLVDANGKPYIPKAAQGKGAGKTAAAAAAAANAKDEAKDAEPALVVPGASEKYPSPSAVIMTPLPFDPAAVLLTGVAPPAQTHSVPRVPVKNPTAANPAGTGPAATSTGVTGTGGGKAGSVPPTPSNAKGASGTATAAAGTPSTAITPTASPPPPPPTASATATASATEVTVYGLPPDAAAEPASYPKLSPVGYLVFNRVMLCSYAHDIENAARRVIAHDASRLPPEAASAATAGTSVTAGSTGAGAALIPYAPSQSGNNGNAIVSTGSGSGTGLVSANSGSSGASLAPPSVVLSAGTPVPPGSRPGSAHGRAGAPPGTPGFRGSVAGGWLGMARGYSAALAHGHALPSSHPGFVQSVCPLDTVVVMLLEQARVTGALGNMKNQNALGVYKAQREIAKLRTLEGGTTIHTSCDITRIYKAFMNIYCIYCILFVFIVFTKLQGRLFTSCVNFSAFPISFPR